MENGSVRLWESFIPTECVLEGEGDHAAVISIAVTPDGASIVTGCKDGIVRLWDMKTRSLTQNFGGLSGPVTSVLFTPSSTRVIGCSGNMIRKWHIEGSIPPLDYVGHLGDILGIVLVYDTKANDSYMVASGSRNGAIHLWSLRNGNLVTAISRSNDQAISFDFHLKAKVLAVATLELVYPCEYLLLDSVDQLC